jgi:uncharacterized membrane protein
MNLSRTTYVVILVGSVVWCLAIVLAPLLLMVFAGAGEAGRAVYAFFRPVCHQLEARSFTIFGAPFAVCMRCSSIYFGFLLGVVLYPVFSKVQNPLFPSRRLLLVAVVPMALDVLPGAAGIHEVTTATRIVTGAIFGVILPFFIVPAAIEAANELFRTRSPFLTRAHK